MRLPLILAALALAGGARLASAAPPRPDHPILGVWTLSLPELDCEETYLFKSDGTTLVTSHEEVAQSVFQIAAQPSAKGFYRLHDKLVRDNGKKDCSGQVTKAGHESTRYVVFHHDGDLFLMCETESLQRCLGPFRRGGSGESI
jgi:hypothetical protein